MSSILNAVFKLLCKMSYFLCNIVNVCEIILYLLTFLFIMFAFFVYYFIKTVVPSS